VLPGFQCQAQGTERRIGAPAGELDGAACIRCQRPQHFGSEAVREFLQLAARVASVLEIVSGEQHLDLRGQQSGAPQRVVRLGQNAMHRGARGLMASLGGP
jgi:hypothetical protein